MTKNLPAPARPSLTLWKRGARGSGEHHHSSSRNGKDHAVSSAGAARGFVSPESRIRGIGPRVPTVATWVAAREQTGSRADPGYSRERLS